MLPGRHGGFGFDEIKQVTLRRENAAIAGPNGGANVLCLAGLLGNDNLIHNPEHKANTLQPQVYSGGVASAVLPGEGPDC